MGEIIRIKENEMHNLERFLNKTSSDIEESSQNLSSSLSSFSNLGLFKTGTKKIADQIGSISKSVSNLGNSVSKQFSLISSNEDALKNKAEAIEIPMDFVTNDSSSMILVETGMLSKNDGEKINSNNSSSQINDEFESSIEFNKNLNEFIKEYETINGEVEVKGQKIDLSNIKKDSEDKINVVDDETVLVKQILSNISKEINDEIKDLNFSCDFENIPLSRMALNEIKFVDYNDAYKIIKKELASILNNGKYNLVNME